MTVIEPYTAECLDCGHIMLLKMQLLSHNSWMALPEDMDLSDTCDECGSDNLKAISEEEGFEKIRSKGGE